MNNLFSSLIVGEVKQIPVSMLESIVLRTAIEQSISSRLSNKISCDTGEDIICLRNMLKNINDNFPL
jgi:hypothetical protein